MLDEFVVTFTKLMDDLDAACDKTMAGTTKRKNDLRNALLRSQ